MPYDSNGNYTLPAIYKAKPATTIMTEQHNTPLEDVQSALNSVLLRNGSVSMTGNWNMGQNKIINLSDGTSDTDAATVRQISKYLPLSGGTLTSDTTIKGVTGWSTDGNYSSMGLVLTGQNGNTVSFRQHDLTNNYTDLAIVVQGYNGANGYFSLRYDGSIWGNNGQFADRNWVNLFFNGSGGNASVTNVCGVNWSPGNKNSYVQITAGGVSLAVPTSDNVTALISNFVAKSTANSDFTVRYVGVQQASGQIAVGYTNASGGLSIAFAQPAGDYQPKGSYQPAGDYVTENQYGSDFSTSDPRVTNLPYNQREVSFNVQITSQGQYVPFPEAFAGVPVSVIATDAGNGASNDAWPVAAPQAGWTAAGCTIFIGSGHVPRQVSIRVKGSR